MPTEAFDILASPPKQDDLPPVVVLFGEDATLLGWVLRALTPEGDAETYEGDETDWRDLRDEVSTVSLFDTGRRTVIVRRSDGLLKKFRTEIEDYLAKPSSAGRLFMELRSCPSNTKVYKAADKQHLLVHCGIPTAARSKNPDTGKLRTFLTKYVAPRHQCQLEATAAETLIDLLGSDLGMLDTEVAKLALYTEPGGKVTDDMVRQIVGGWRAATVWNTIDAAANGNAAETLRQVDKMMAGGEQPAGILPQFAWSLRRLGMATSAIEHAEQSGKRMTVAAALAAAGVREYEIQKVERQLRQLGRARARKLQAWLLEADLKLKGSHSAPGRDRWVLEELVLKLAREH